ncbi:MAG: peptide-methionine (S)-S-oxide reductase MsrA [Candidatus Micrarchaeota archaeon]|nr:peptide-methionine (S)-S-oxide reductase MsrA [Candidatus Micrarchaeota archaeon]MDE1834514.1 peptide-methionine (S)-S-oxide reductase MsrA [Candidatus Micrarchaeota archaeon]MDE1859290.1 peptide-methionine (S)-S-oxide reductase MsrA [Candidatus Micrarchaeota archaeon]
MKSETVVFGGGCFWCTEAVFLMFPGVLKTTVGYAGGTVANPSYEDVCTGTTGHAEVMKLEYDPDRLALEKILDVFFSMHDPTSLNKQGADMGTQYRSAIYYTNDAQKDIIDRFIKNVGKEYSKPIVIEVKKLDKFYPAEEHHQRYFEKNPYGGYCSFVIKPKLEKVIKEFKDDIK